jgi:NAD(P)-dependent dehydrogenase (short-subunit alcohol dehydrogenase family)
MHDLYSSQAFEEKYTYTGCDLGVTWTQNQTIFRVWAPTAETVSLNLYRSGTPGAQDFLCQMHMYPGKNGTWTAVRPGNLNGVYYFAREAGRYMVEAGYGKVINIGSIHSTVALPGSPLTAYCATKGAVAMLTKSLANEWAKKGITVNAIGPAYFESEMTAAIFEDPALIGMIAGLCPMGRPGRPGELDGALVYFASDASSYTTGQLLTVDGGWTTV